MTYLDGEPIRITAESLTAHIGEQVQYLLERDIDKSGRGYFWPRYGTITKIYNRQVIFNEDNWQPFSAIREIVKNPTDA